MVGLEGLCPRRLIIRLVVRVCPKLGPRGNFSAARVFQAGFRPFNGTGLPEMMPQGLILRRQCHVRLDLELVINSWCRISPVSPVQTDVESPS